MGWKWVVAVGILGTGPVALASSPEELIGSFPKVPSNGCGVDPEEKAAYLERVQAAATKVREELDRRNETVEQGVAAQEGALRANALASTGMPPEQAASMVAAAERTDKVKDPAERKAQRKKIADAYMQGKMNVSVEEIDKMKGLSAEGKQEWAKAYVSEQQALADADPAGTAAAMKRQADETKSTKDATDRQQVLMKTLQAGPTRIGQQLMQNESREEAVAALRELNLLRNDRQERMSSGKGLDGLSQLNRRIRQGEIAYCRMLSPPQLKLIADYRSLVVNSMPKYRELDRANAEALSVQYGVKPSAASEGKSGLEALLSLSTVMGQAYAYYPGVQVGE